MRRNGSHYLKTALLVLLGLVIIGYGIFNFRIFIAGPKIIITSPQNGETVTTELIKVTGVVENTSFISINDRPIFVNESGDFEEFLLLSSGYNIISFKAHDQFQREVSEKLEVFYQGESVRQEEIRLIESTSASSTNATTSPATSTEESSE